jgi:hypothetical protein
MNIGVDDPGSGGVGWIVATYQLKTVLHGPNCSCETIANLAARMRCVMLIRALYFEQASIVAAVVCSLIVAGFLKGIIGVGMPVVALPLLSLFIDIKSAAMLLSMPLILGNLPQALEGGKTGRCLMQSMPVILGMIPGLFFGVRVLLALDANTAKIIAGLVLMGISGVTLLAPKVQLQSRSVLLSGVTFGFFGGILGGIAAMPGPLVFVFLLAKGLRGKAFTKEAFASRRELASPDQKTPHTTAMSRNTTGLGCLRWKRANLSKILQRPC